MSRRKKSNPVDVNVLTKKYKCDISKIIKLWKAERSDSEISAALGIDLLRLMQIRQDIEQAHLKEKNSRIKSRPTIF